MLSFYEEDQKIDLISYLASQGRFVSCFLFICLYSKKKAETQPDFNQYPVADRNQSKKKMNTTYDHIQ